MYVIDNGVCGKDFTYSDSGTCSYSSLELSKSQYLTTGQPSAVPEAARYDEVHGQLHAANKWCYRLRYALSKCYRRVYMLARDP